MLCGGCFARGLRRRLRRKAFRSVAESADEWEGIQYGLAQRPPAQQQLCKLNDLIELHKKSPTQGNI